MGASASYPLHLWHGFAPELFVTAAAITVGALLMTRRRTLYPIVQRDFLPGTGADALERIFDAAAKLGHRIAQVVAVDHPRRHVVPPLIVLTLLLGVGSIVILTSGTLPATQPDLLRPI